MAVIDKLVQHAPQNYDLAPESDCKAALIRILECGDYKPLDALVSGPVAVQCEKYLADGAGKLTYEWRNHAFKIVRGCCTSEFFGLTQRDLLRKLGLRLDAVGEIEKVWRSFWAFNNVIAHRSLVETSFSQVVAATCEYAIKGSSRDRRLYFDLFTSLGKKEEKDQSTGAQLVFINNVITRPEYEGQKLQPAEQSVQSRGLGPIYELKAYPSDGIRITAQSLNEKAEELDYASD